MGKIKEQEDIICMPFTIRILRIYGIIPKKGQLLTRSKLYYVNFGLRIGATLILVLGSISHLFKNMHDNFYNHPEIDFTYIISISAAFGIIGSYYIKLDVALKLYLGLSDFNEFGKPNHFDETNEKLSKYSKVHFAYLHIIVFVVLCISNVFRGATCRRENEEKNIHEICGLFTYTWLPFNIEFFPVKQIYLSIQLFAADYVYILTGLIAWIVWESVEHLAVKIRYVSYLLNESIKEENPKIRRQKFNFAVRCHLFVLELEKKFNEAYNLVMFAHTIMTAVVMGYGVYQYIEDKNTTAFLVTIGWLVGLLLDCYSGQRLYDEGELLRESVFQTEWYNCDLEMKKDVMFVMMMCRKPMVLRAASFGVMDHPMFLAVLKASYSYITLMNNKKSIET